MLIRQSTPRAVMTAALLLTAVAVAAQPPHPLQQALKDEVKGDWHYNDFAAGLAEARKTGKPLLVVFR